MNKLISFEDFGKQPVPAVKKPAPQVREAKSGAKPVAKPVSKPAAKPAAKPAPKPAAKSVKESALLVDTDYKVKLSLDVPVALVKSYIDKVKSETQKDPLQGNTESELAEEIVRYLVKKHLVIDQIPSSLAVGQGEEQQQVAADAPTETQNDEQPVETEQQPAAEDDVYAGAQEVDIEDEPAEEGDHKGIEFETEEAETGEGGNIQLDPNQKVK